MTLPKKHRRSIVVDGELYHWLVGRRMEEVGAHLDVELTLFVETPCQSKKVRASFRGVGVEFLYSGLVQDLVIRPGVVRQVIEAAAQRGWPKALHFAMGEEAFPDAVERVEVHELILDAAREQWFVS